MFECLELLIQYYCSNFLSNHKIFIQKEYFEFPNSILNFILLLMLNRQLLFSMFDRHSLMGSVEIFVDRRRDRNLPVTRHLTLQLVELGVLGQSSFLKRNRFANEATPRSFNQSYRVIVIPRDLIRVFDRIFNPDNNIAIFNHHVNFSRVDIGR